MGMKLPPELEQKVLEMAGESAKGTHPAPEPEISEKEFDAKVVDYAERRGWLSYHTWNSRRSAKGFPDRVFVRERVVWAELKDESGAMSKEQREWRDALQRAGAEWYLWRPSDWSRIVEILQ